MSQSEAGSTAPISSEILDAMQRLHNGDLTVQLSDNHGQLATLFNQHVQMLNLFANELTRLVRDVGTEGRLGSQMEVSDAEGTWRDLVSNVNNMSDHLTVEVRELAGQVTGIARGDLTRRSTAAMSGEFLECQKTLNVFTIQMQSLCSELGRVSREVGTEGKFGPQAEVRGIMGDWETLVSNVNVLSANLTNQIRDLSYTTRAAAEGKPVRPLTCGVEGEMAELFSQVSTITQR